MIPNLWTCCRDNRHHSPEMQSLYNPRAALHLSGMRCRGLEGIAVSQPDLVQSMYYSCRPPGSTGSLRFHFEVNLFSVEFVDKYEDS